MKYTRRLSVAINAGSMADIAFLLLIFFLIATQIKEEKGIHVNLPKWTEPMTSTATSENIYFQVVVNAAEEILINEEITEANVIRNKLFSFLTAPENNPSKVLVSLRMNENISYEMYITVYNELLAAIRKQGTIIH